MIKPHGADALNPLFVYDTQKHHALLKEAETLPSLLLNSAAAANAVMLGAGYFTPLNRLHESGRCAQRVGKTAHHRWSVLAGADYQSVQGCVGVSLAPSALRCAIRMSKAIPCWR